jgi:hypothetical protein
MWERQLITSFILSLLLLGLIVRLVQKGRLDIAYCWLWLGIGFAAILVVLHYDWLTRFSELIGAVANTTTLFLIGFFVVLLLCLQFSLIISHQRRQIKRLSQQLALSHPLRATHNTTGEEPTASRNPQA